MAVTLAQLLTGPVLERKGGPRSYQRGLEYFRRGRVVSVEPYKNGIRASVAGEYDYDVALTVVNGQLRYECNCPMAGEGNFCKHCVAVGFAWLHGEGRETPGERITMDDVAQQLNKETAAKLAAMILDWATDDDQLTQRLLHYAARRTGPKSAVAAARAAFEKAAKPRYFAYGEAAAYAAAVDRAIDAFEKILE